MGYPALYAESSHPHAKEFNSTQRGHQNMMESWGPLLCAMMGTGLVYPRASAACGFIYSVGRLIYGFGYAHFGPNGRFLGIILAHFGDIPLFLMAFFVGHQLVT